MKIKHKLPLRDRIYWKNFFFCMFIFIVIIIAITLSDEYFTLFNWKQYSFSAYSLVSFFAILYTCHRIALDFAHSEDIENIKKEIGLSNQEFNERYGAILDKLKI